MKKVFILTCTALICTNLFAAKPKNTKLCNAIEKGDVEGVKKELAAHPEDVNKIGAFYDSPMAKAASRGNLEIIELLLDAGGEIDSRTLSYAKNKKNYEVFTFFYDRSLIDDSQYLSGISGIFKEETLSFDEKLEKIKEVTKGNLITPKFLFYVSPEEYTQTVTFFNIDLEKPIDKYGTTILQFACDNFKLELVTYLIEKVNINAVNNNGENALFFACTAYGPMIDAEKPVIEDETTAKIKFISDMPYYSNAKEVQMKQLQIVQMLLNKKININAQDKFGWTVLHYASAFYPDGLQELLINSGANTSLKTNFGRTAADIKALRK